MTTQTPIPSELPFESTVLRDVTITHVNGNGLRIRGDDRWYNLSKFASPAPAMPQVGDTVTLSVNPQGYIYAITPELSEKTVRSAPHQPVPYPGVTGEMAREMRIVALRTAVEYVSKTQDVGSGPARVTQVASIFYQWLTSSVNP